MKRVQDKSILIWGKWQTKTYLDKNIIETTIVRRGNGTNGRQRFTWIKSFMIQTIVRRGWCTVHDEWLVHSSGGNSSDRFGKQADTKSSQNVMYTPKGIKRTSTKLLITIGKM